jgi:hypothetical protein
MKGIYRSNSMRPLNCDIPDPYDADLDEKTRKRCPDCKQFHLRPGYCQARDAKVGR